MEVSKAYSLKAVNKPVLFSWDLDTEFKNIDHWVLDTKNYSRRNLENELTILKNLASDYLQIIQTKTLGSEQLGNLMKAIINGPGGVWEQATTKLERLAYHFQDAKELIRSMINSTDSNIVYRALEMLNDAFTEDEQIEILEKVFSHKSKRIRERAAGTAFYLKNRKLIPLLLEKKKLEKDEAVKDAINITIEHLKQVLIKKSLDIIS